MSAAHQCHAHGCTRRVPPRMFACRQHWFGLPKKIQDAFKPRDEAAALVCAGYLQEAIAFAEKAKSLGLGDPLDGIIPGAEP